MSGVEKEAALLARDQSGLARIVSDFEKEALFQEWVKRALGTNPDKMDDDAYMSSFEAFKSHMFRVAPEQPPSNPPPCPFATKARGTGQVEDEKEELIAVDERVRELYRRLVRRLHPDLRADGSTAVSALWHEVQEAYAASDVARMEILLALSDIEANQMANQTVGQTARGSNRNWSALCRRWKRACAKPKARMRGISRGLVRRRPYGRRRNSELKIGPCCAHATPRAPDANDRRMGWAGPSVNRKSGKS